MILDCSLLDDTSWMISLCGLWVISECTASFCTAFYLNGPFRNWLNHSTDETKLESPPQHNKPPHDALLCRQRVCPCVSLTESLLYFFFFTPKIVLPIKHATHTECFHWFLVYSLLFVLTLCVVQLWCGMPYTYVHFKRCMFSKNKCWITSKTYWGFEV